MGKNVLHVGKNNRKFEYTMNGEKLIEVHQERDVGVFINQDLKPSLQFKEASRRATGVLNQRKEYILENFTQFVRCHLEFAVSAWAPWTAQDIEVLEKV